jgi:hypothetical protein
MNPQRYATVGRLTLQKAQTDDRARAIQELNDAVGGSQETLVSATTTFPFVLFPDTISVDRTKVTITRRTFFQVAQVMSIQVEDILNVTANVGPFFGSLKITTRYFDTKKPPYTITFLKREEALRVKRIIQGYLLARLKEIDCTALSTQELADKLDELGKSAPE